MLPSSAVLVPLVMLHGVVRPNARFVVNPSKRTARLEVTRRIKAGGEIFVSYGTDYWKNAHSTSHSTTNIPDWEWDTSDPFPFVPSLTSPPSLPSIYITPAPSEP